jgi:hypothetical protein
MSKGYVLFYVPEFSLLQNPLESDFIMKKSGT